MHRTVHGVFPAPDRESSLPTIALLSWKAVIVVPMTLMEWLESLGVRIENSAWRSSCEAGTSGTWAIEVSQLLLQPLVLHTSIVAIIQEQDNQLLREGRQYLRVQVGCPGVV